MQKRSVVKVLGWLMCWLAAGLVQGQSYYASVEKISVADGLPDSTIYTIIKDAEGFIWLGSPTAVSRYDGYEFRKYSRYAQPPYQLVVGNSGNIFIDSRGWLWIGTWGEGLAVYDRDMKLKRHFFHEQGASNSLGSNLIQTAFEDSGGNVWVGTSGGGVSRYRVSDGDLQRFVFDGQNDTSLSHNRVWSISQTDDGHLWFATSNGLNRMDPAKPGVFVRYQYDAANQQGLDHALVRALLSYKGQLWVGTESGFGWLDVQNGRFHQIELFPNQARAAITRIIPDQKGGIWVGTQKGLFRWDTNTQSLTGLVNDRSFQLFPHNDIRDLLIDDSGVLWVATRFTGLVKVNLSANSFNYLTRYQGRGRQGYAVNNIFDVHPDRAGRLWLASGDGLLRLTDKGTQLMQVPQGDRDLGYGIKALTDKVDGGLWAGGIFGLLSFDPASGKFDDANHILEGLAVGHVQDLLLAGDGALWIGTADDGLVRYSSDGNIERFRHEPENAQSLSFDGVTQLFEDSQGRLWIGTPGSGLNRYDSHHGLFVRYLSDRANPQSLSSNVINTVYQTRDSVMWVGTAKGLNKLDDTSGTFRHYNREDGLIDDNVRGIIEDIHGDLWITTSKGISRFNRSEGYFVNFSDGNNLQDSQMLNHALAVGENNTLYFGSGSGLYRVNPRQIKINDHLPNVSITDVWVDNIAVPRHRFAADKPLKLDHKVKSIRLRFTALDFQAPEKNLYSYRLDGVDSQWSDPSSVRTVTFTRLAPGSYDFEVKGSNNANQWHPEPARFHWSISPPWHTLWWVRLILIALMSAMIFAWYRYRVVAVARQKQALEQQVAERTSELLKQKEALEDAHEQLNRQSEALKEYNDELTATLAQTAEFQDQLVEKEKMAALGNMVAGIAHEINTPIGLGVTATTLMQDRLKDMRRVFDSKKLSAARLDKYLVESDESLGIIYRNLDRAAELIGSFKQLSVDQSSDEKRTFELRHLIDEVLVSLRPQLKRVKHEMVVDCASDIVIRSTPGALSQILINLIMNSLIHAFEDIEAGQMKLSAVVEHNDCRITYQDNGNGVSEKVRTRIFEPFTTTRRGAGGSGLGMHLVYNLATQALHGTIEMNSEINKGVEFILTIPISTRRRQTEAESADINAQT